MCAHLHAQVSIPKFDVQGHRGARGLMPENTLPAFQLAMDSGVTTLEMDVVITKDNKIVVSHEPWMSAVTCTDSTGAPILPVNEKKHNIFHMTYDQVAMYDCGMKVNLAFPNQLKIPATKPLLEEVILATENYTKNYTMYEVDYNIEIKTEKGGDGKFHPAPREFSDLVFDMIDQYLPWDRVTIQSFDFRVLKYWHQKHPEVKLSALVENRQTMDENLKALGFIPAVYSPDFKLLSKETIQHGHDLKMRVIPWTVNEPAKMEELKSWGVDGIITDYPDRAKKIGLTMKVPVPVKP